jgi:hypothetical protein
MDRESDPEKRKQLALAWNQVSGASWDTKRSFEAALIKTSPVDAWNQGAEARAAGEVVSANPYGSRFWGNGRRWRRGWTWVDQNPDWIETFKERAKERHITKADRIV